MIKCQKSELSDGHIHYFKTSDQLKTSVEVAATDSYARGAEASVD
jgi:redox-regulated HSP33 family molecular chaperone